MRKTGPGLRICVVGPLPPPSGGMANQCEQLARLLCAEGLEVELVRNNAYSVLAHFTLKIMT